MEALKEVLGAKVTKPKLIGQDEWNLLQKQN